MSEDEEKSVWPTVEMRTTGYIDPIYGEKKTLSENAPEKFVIGDGIKDIAFTAEKEQWEDFRATVNNTPFVFEPPPLRKPIHGNTSALTSKEANQLNTPPTMSSIEYSEALTSRVMPRGPPRVITMTKDGLPIHKGDDPNLLNLRGHYLTAAQYNQPTCPQTTCRTIAKEIAYRESSVREMKIIACQECFPEMGQWTINEQDVHRKESVCGNYRGPA
ncbi:hypothetical protein E6O75_ATG09023 [Venturia nashicola]|uniref:Uncharacterized protein n=1 Tax=Venturia nashicola TaxID=86259 RepID=A0A4Z1NK25_9PEZI|nr:hypothetical protein E6O75_ATG09023 [Venturia nashicola]